MVLATAGDYWAWHKCWRPDDGNGTCDRVEESFDEFHDDIVMFTVFPDSFSQEPDL